MGVIRSSGFRKICIGETALLVSTLAFVPVMFMASIIISASDGFDNFIFSNDVVYIMLSGAAFLSFLIIFSGVVECGADCKSMRRAKLFIIIQLIMSVISILFEGVDIDYYFSNSPIILTNWIIGLFDSITSAAHFLSSFLGILYLLGGFREAWYICGGDEETNKSITSLQLQYAVNTSILVMVFLTIVTLVLFAFYRPNPSELVISASKWATVCGLPAIFILAVWKIVIHIRIVRMSWLVTRTIAEISGG